VQNKKARYMKNITFEQLPQAVSELYGKLESIEQLLLAGNANPTQDTKDLLTIQEAGVFLHLSVPTLYGYVSKNTIPFSKRPGSKRLWFSKKELTDWIKAGRKQTIAEVNAEVEESLTTKNNKK
jgi:excisionase family DNA binding protein